MKKDMMNKDKSKVAVITGGGHGIGEAIITGENICIDGGMTKQMIYHGEHGWSFKDKGEMI